MTVLLAVALFAFHAAGSLLHARFHSADAGTRAGQALGARRPAGETPTLHATAPCAVCEFYDAAGDLPEPGRPLPVRSVATLTPALLVVFVPAERSALTRTHARAPPSSVPS